MRKKRIFITGGHLTPALAVIDEIRKANEWEIFFVGRKYPLEGDKAVSLEYRIIKKLKIPFLELTTGRFQRRFTLYTLFSLLKIPIGFLQSFFYLIKYKPDIILSFGSYLALPVALSGFLLRIPIITHEQTRSAGLANRIIGLLAKRVCISYLSSQKFFPKRKTVLTGNPLRQEIWENKPAFWQKSIGQPLLYITGGSLGSHKINVLIEEIIKELLSTFFIIHQTGDSKVYKDYERLKEKRNLLPSDLKRRYFLRKYIELGEIGWTLNNASLIISRAGANTVAEIISLLKPAILIPLPYALEQKENAKIAEEVGLAKVLDEEVLDSQKLLLEIRKFWLKIIRKEIKIDKKRYKSYLKNNSTLLIVKEIYETTRIFTRA